MAFFDKLNQVAKNIGDKTSDAIETTRLNSKIAAEKLAANEELLKIGQHYYDLYLAGQAEVEILEYCQAAKVHLDTADQMQGRHGFVLLCWGPVLLQCYHRWRRSSRLQIKGKSSILVTDKNTCTGG